MGAVWCATATQPCRVGHTGGELRSCDDGFYFPNKGLEPFIETLTEAQKAEISKKFENCHKTGRLKGGAANAARSQFAKSSDALSESEG